MWAKITLGFTICLLLGCSQPVPPPAVATAASATESVATVAAPSPVAQLPPTFTPHAVDMLPSPTPRPTLLPATPAPTNTPIDFDQTAVEVRYQIPALGLDRRLQGNINSQIIYVDESSGIAFQRNNQASILLELQQALPNLELADIPDDCDSCVRLSYDLPLRGEAGSGWLQNRVLLASIENLMAVNLGPHWPPEAVVGLRRTASVYEPAHTIALAADGRLWSWLATAADTGPPQTVNAELLFNQPHWPPMPGAADYLVPCPGVAVETLWWQTDPEEAEQIRFTCPEYSLPFSLVPLYGQLSDWLEPTLATLTDGRRPPARFPLQGWLMYERPNGSRLILFQDGRLEAVGAGGLVVTDTLSIDVASELVADLLVADLVAPGLSTFLDETTAGTAGTTLLIRTEGGVYDGRFSSPSARPELDPLNEQLDRLLGINEPSSVNGEP
ncbi:MAG: hypothetical protein R6X32_01810 [Chloroflexota bacterium]